MPASWRSAIWFPFLVAGGVLVTAAAIVGPLVEIAIVALGAASYGDRVDGLGGVAPWLPFLYFAAGAVATRLWPAIARDGRLD